MRPTNKIIPAAKPKAEQDSLVLLIAYIEDQKGAVPPRPVPHGRDQREAEGGVWLQVTALLCLVGGEKYENHNSTVSDPSYRRNSVIRVVRCFFAFSPIRLLGWWVGVTSKLRISIRIYHLYILRYCR